MFPTRSQHKISVMLNEMNQQSGSYIRGQITVTISFWIYLYHWIYTY